MELRLAQIDSTSYPLGETGAKRRVMGEVSRGNFDFVTYAVEIEGEAPLIFVAEAVDD
jgi:hypothetical protein